MAEKIELREVKPPTSAEQAACNHDWSKAFSVMSGEVMEMWKKCKLKKDIRPMTEKEAEDFYANL